MLKIALNKVYLTKGDTARFDITLAMIPGVSCDYELNDEDQVYFIVTKCPKIIPIESLDTSASCVFYKKGRTVIINPEDTQDLEDGLYYYQVRVILRESGDLNTIIEPEDFYITPEEIIQC